MPHCPGFDQWTALRQAEWNQAANGGKKSAGFNLRAPNTQPQLAHCPFYPTSHLRLGGNSRVTLSFSVESCDCCLSGKKYIIIYLLSKRCELHWATPLLFLDYLTFKCVFWTSVHLCLFTSRSPPQSAVYLTIVVFSVPPNRAFLSSCLTSRLSYCRNKWHSSVGCTSPRHTWQVHPERGLLKVSHSCQSH